VHIPEITDLSLFPTVHVRHPDPNFNVPEVPFVKLELPEDKCNPLPKPKAKGLLGAVLNVANKIADTLLDAACHITFPVVEGELPDWVNFSVFPDPYNFPPPPDTNPKDPEDPEDPEDPQDPEGTKTASSSSSSCSPTQIPSCDITSFISGTSVQTAITSCTTTSACSGVGITRQTGITSTCTETAIPNCRGTNLVTGTETTFFTTSCSTISACSGRGVTSVTDITAMPMATVEFEVHPEIEERWFEKQQCVLSLLDDPGRDIQQADVASCYGDTLPSPATSIVMSSTQVESTTPAPPPPSSSSPPPPPPPPPALPANRALNIMIRNSPLMSWTFHEASYGTQADPCTASNVAEDDVEPYNQNDITNPPWPNGSWSITVHDTECTYSSDGKGPGKLECGSMDQNMPAMLPVVECKEEVMKKEKKTISCPADGIEYHPVAYCEWRDPNAS
jgi:hypothetical protein